MYKQNIQLPEDLETNPEYLKYYPSESQIETIIANCRYVVKNDGQELE